MEHTIWQIGAGGRERAYCDLFLRHSVVLIGPGYSGKWTPGKSDDDFEGPFVRRFAQDVKRGHVLVAREGGSRIRAVGLVASDEYLYLDEFADVKGWDLRHAKRVRWSPLIEHVFDTPVFGANPSRISRTYNREVAEYVSRFLNSSPVEWQTAPLRDLPAREPEMDEPPAEIADIVSVARDLGNRYWALGKCIPSELEMISHFVVPLLYRLRWRQEEIAVEWNNIDVALFKDLPRSPENCFAIIEAKRFGTGVESALPQARSYCSRLKILCPIFITDGFRYALYLTPETDEPDITLNLLLLRQSSLKLLDFLKRPIRSEQSNATMVQGSPVT
jgi:hypothetical protein